MKHLAILLFLVGFNAFAETNPGPVQVWCAKQIALCDPSTKMCNWRTGETQTFSIQLEKTGSGLSPKIWNGHLSASLEGQSFRVFVFQQAENQSVDFISVEFAAKRDEGTFTSGMGHQVVEVQSLDAANLVGNGMICTTNRQLAQ